MFIPEYVKKCLDRLENAGFSAYIVGGCVRDACLGITPQDYDMCTSALPEQTEALFSDHHLVLAGKKHGTVGVVTDGGVVEITTFRTEGDYADNRHPAWVAFVPVGILPSMPWPTPPSVVLPIPLTDNQIWNIRFFGPLEIPMPAFRKILCGFCGVSVLL